ncbi:MAG: S-layer homology domain-containing protein [Thermoleophilia bacterium]|nr:S-layer homology domain-containing protein [Thermoleophilia bacterium]
MWKSARAISLLAAVLLVVSGCNSPPTPSTTAATTGVTTASEAAVPAIPEAVPTSTSQTAPTAGGHPGGTNPSDDQVTRAEWARMLCLALRLPVVEGAFPCPFSDVETPEDDLFPDDFVTVAAANQLVSGGPGGVFRPSAGVSRAAAVDQIVRGLKAGWPDLLDACTEAGLEQGLEAVGPDSTGLMARDEAERMVQNLTELTKDCDLESRYRPVLHPYHNRCYQYVGFASTVTDLVFDPTEVVAARVFPQSVPAFYAPLRPVPVGTDLLFQTYTSADQLPPDMEATPNWQDPAMEELLAQRRDPNNAKPPPLHNESVVLPLVRSFLHEHHLWQTDLDKGDAVWGQTAVIDGVERAVTVAVTYHQTGVTGDGTLPGQLRGDVTAGDRLVSLEWALIDPQVIGQVSVRSCEEILADTQAWLDGDVDWDRWPSPEGPRLRVAVTGVLLDYERIRFPAVNDPVALTLIPVYRFQVRITEPAEYRGATGTWTVCAAADALLSR